MLKKYIIQPVIYVIDKQPDFLYAKHIPVYFAMQYERTLEPFLENLDIFGKCCSLLNPKIKTLKTFLIMKCCTFPSIRFNVSFYEQLLLG